MICYNVERLDSSQLEKQEKQIQIIKAASIVQVVLAAALQENKPAITAEEIARIMDVILSMTLQPEEEER